jgi:exodeoxyribonuclease-3
VNVYVPNSGQGLKRLDYRQKWDKDFRKYLTDLQEKKPVIVCGDFNVAHQAIDLKNDKSNYNKTSGYTQVEIDGMTTLQNAGFIDTFRKLHPDKEAYSYWSYRFNARARNTGWRIDYFLVSERLMEKVVRSEILPDYLGSDHCPVELKLDL